MKFKRILERAVMAADIEKKHGNAARPILETGLFIGCLVEAEAAAAKGDHLAQRVFVQMGAMAPHLINGES